MAESPDLSDDAGARIAPDAIDPDLIKLKRARPKIGVITSAGVVLLAIVFIVRLNGDRTFGGGDAPVPTTVADVLAGKVSNNSYITLDAEPMMSHAIRAGRSRNSVGFRVAPIRGSGDRLWLVINGDGWDRPATTGYTGRLRALDDLPFTGVAREFTADHPRPVFATAAAARAGFTTGKVATVAGDTITIADGDQVALDVIDAGSALLVASFNERHPNEGAWIKALTDAGITVGQALELPTGASRDQVRFEVKLPAAVATLTAKLEAAQLFAARVEPITRHYKTTWGALKASTAAGFNVGTATIADAELDLVGLYVAKGIPEGAYALITGEKPQQYWYVLPITIALAIIGLLFGWALVRAVRRDLLPPTRTP